MAEYSESESPDRRLLVALERIDEAAAANVERSRAIQQRVQCVREGLHDGTALSTIIGGEASPRLVELISQNMATLESVGAEVRASLAMALREEGLTIEAIADLFGVTRQRISALLRQKAARDLATGTEEND